jgi:hypothetical protein
VPTSQKTYCFFVTKTLWLMLSRKAFVFTDSITCKKKKKTNIPGGTQVSVYLALFTYTGWHTGVCVLSTIHQQIVLHTHTVPTTKAWSIVLRQKLRVSWLGKKFRAHYELPSSLHHGTALIKSHINPTHIRTHHNKSVLREDGIFCINSWGQLRSSPLTWSWTR